MGRFTFWKVWVNHPDAQRVSLTKTLLSSQPCPPSTLDFRDSSKNGNMIGAR